MTKVEYKCGNTCFIRRCRLLPPKILAASINSSVNTLRISLATYKERVGTASAVNKIISNEARSKKVDVTSPFSIVIACRNEKAAIITIGIIVKLSKKASNFENPLFTYIPRKTPKQTPNTIRNNAISIEIPTVHFAPSITKFSKSNPF